MPRRKPKHAFRAGEPSANPYGRPPGSVNEINRRIKEAFTMILENKLPELEEWLTRAAHKDPLKTADLLLRISERFTPSLSRTEITGAEGLPFTPITINLPNIPKVSLGEGAPVLPLDSPREIGEGSLAEIPMFLPDKEKIPDFREGAPTEDPGEAWGELRENPFNKL
jgi:hypothetical protein